MQQPGGCCLAQEEYQAVLAVIEEDGLWWAPGERSSRISPSLIKRGWSIEAGVDLEPFVAVAIRVGHVKRLMLRTAAPLSSQAAALAHALAHDILGHPYEIDLIGPSAVQGMVINRGVHPAHDNAAAAASSLLLIPEWFVEDGYSVAEIVSWCGVPTAVAVRRLTEIVVRADDPPSILRLGDWRRTERVFVPQAIVGGGGK